MRRLLLAILILSSATHLFAKESAAPDACALLSPREVREGVGEGFEPLPRMPSGDYSMCTHRRDKENLMERFYAELAAGRDRSRALRGAQLATLAALRAGELRAPSGRAIAESPACWAPFVLVGEPR